MYISLRSRCVLDILISNLCFVVAKSWHTAALDDLTLAAESEQVCCPASDLYVLEVGHRLLAL